jgi:predicted MFS family arabinose efflux permease
MLMIASAYSLWLILFAGLLFAAGTGGALPAIQTDCLKKLDITRRTVATGTYLIGFDIGMTIGQIFGGVFSDTFGFRSTFNGTGILMLAGFVCYFIYNKRGPAKHEAGL